jgi:P pilus assembly chaperone PapD
MKKNQIICLVVFLIIFNSCFVACSWAGIRIDKPKIRLTIVPGSYDGGEVKVENNGNEPAAVKVYLEDWAYKMQDGGKEFMPKGTTPLSCSNWITFYPADFIIPVNGAQMVRYTVTVPKNVKGGYYSVMFFETGGGEMEKLDEQGNTMTVKVLNRLGALFYVEPQGTIQKTAELKNLEISQNLNRFNVSAQLINTGNTDIAASGTFNVMDAQGYVYARGEFEDVYTLPKDKALIKAQVPATNLKAGDYDILITLDFQNGGNLIKEAKFSVEPSGAVTSIIMKD